MYSIIVSDFPRPEGGVFCILIFDIVSISVLVGFSLICASKYYYMKGHVCYVLPYYSHYLYSELSILFLFYDHEIHLCRFILYYFTSFYESIVIFIMFPINHHGILLFSRNFSICSFVVFWAQIFTSNKEIHNVPIFDQTKSSPTTEIWSNIGGWLIVWRDIVTQI